MDAVEHEASTHRHLCAGCEAVITVDRSRDCQTEDDHVDGFCEMCALAEPGVEEMIA